MFTTYAGWIWMLVVDRHSPLQVQAMACASRSTHQRPRSDESAPIAPFLLIGETTHAFMSVEYWETRVTQEFYKDFDYEFELGTYL